METKAVHRYLASLNLRVVSAAVLAAIAGLALLASPASAKRFNLVGRDGKIHGCYRVKGKPKGMLRVVRARHYHCKRGERKVAWSVAGAAGPSGQDGTSGQDGQAGSNGSTTTTTNTTTTTKEAALETEVAGLTTRVESLEGLLEGLVGEVNATNNLLSGVETGDLSGVLSRVNGLEGVLEGVDNEGLKEAIAALPTVEQLCTQTPVLAEQANALQETIEGLGLNSVLTTLGGLIEISGLPEELELGEFGCGTP